MFKLGKCSEDSLPPNFDSLYQHILRVNFASYVGKNCTIPTLNAPLAVGYGWSLPTDTFQTASLKFRILHRNEKRTKLY